MSPPEIWGPPIWTLFHVLAEKINEKHFHYLFPELLNYIKRICSFLPCPEFSRDATFFLSKITPNTIKNKNDFINTIYIFHNYVNSKKNKPLFNYNNIKNYKYFNVINIFNNFIRNYNTKGNMKLLSESFQRKLIIKDFSLWFKKNIRCFIQFSNYHKKNSEEPHVSDENKEFILDTINEESDEQTLLNDDENKEFISDTVNEESNEQTLLNDEENNLIKKYEQDYDDTEEEYSDD